MKTCILPFHKVADYDCYRAPKVLLRQDIKDWVEANQGSYTWLINSVADLEEWRVAFSFESDDQTIVFKLTFG
jgi:hypothetical protein